MNKYHTGTAPIAKPLCETAVRVYINACHTAYRFLLVDKQLAHWALRVQNRVSCDTWLLNGDVLPVGEPEPPAPFM